jgi:hypothetical protein
MTGIFFPFVARWLHAAAVDEPKPPARPVTTSTSSDHDRAKRRKAALERLAKTTKKWWSA